MKMVIGFEIERGERKGVFGLRKKGEERGFNFFSKIKFAFWGKSANFDSIWLTAWTS